MKEKLKKETHKPLPIWLEKSSLKSFNLLAVKQDSSMQKLIEIALKKVYPTIFK